jgi:hypothetical protein
VNNKKDEALKCLIFFIFFESKEVSNSEKGLTLSLRIFIRIFRAVKNSEPNQLKNKGQLVER